MKIKFTIQYHNNKLSHLQFYTTFLLEKALLLTVHCSMWFRAILFEIKCVYNLDITDKCFVQTELQH